MVKETALSLELPRLTSLLRQSLPEKVVHTEEKPTKLRDGDYSKESC